ncbi:MAG: TsaC protein (YrdC domain) required for threonylcarbamoyladenosine t(6)A37 modification in tRNA [uncultured Thermomicrobiales bacterium]|uniref:L-threonylcarbamoyladenylate synthase n=1 Tax=uncultured Thermomicrobiales bacterium TaxID=1645740 RepID=A0A6J4VGD6_9BACT|nr:MAG: TsaC protein (YrdC domain) required for threonylcarbamoyladenosine t(6)A37 modification in tRNA [uncultured Thermomicrobiales bacterium]
MTILTLEEPRALERAIASIQHGGVIAFPTDTVYGLGGSLAYPEALERIFAIKGRDRTRPLPVLLASPSDLSIVTASVSPALREMARLFWPGPLTIALPALETLPAQVVAHDNTVGVRVPDHSVALTIAQRCGGAIAVTSANISGMPPACRGDEIDPVLADQIDLVLDGGIAPCGRPSSVIRDDGDTIVVIREGAIPTADLMAAWDRVRADSTGGSGDPDQLLEAGTPARS